MPSFRVTQGMMTRQTLNDLGFQTRRLLQLQRQLSTGLRVNAPSDDPLAARRAVNVRAAIAQTEQYITNISTAEPYLSQTDSSIQSVIKIIQRGQELTAQGANGTNSQAQLDAIALEVNQLLEGLVNQANVQTQGRYLFAGTCSTSPPFVATRNGQGEITAVSYVGNDNSISIPAGAGVNIAVNETGQDAFLNTQDMFQALIDIRDNLRTGNTTYLQNQGLNDLKASLGEALSSIARVGAIENRLDRLKTDLEDYSQQLQVTLSDNIDADYAETVIGIGAQSNAYQAALNAASRILQPSLLDFLS